jgi:aminopeptidase YwaD
VAFHIFRFDIYGSILFASSFFSPLVPSFISIIIIFFLGMHIYLQSLLKKGIIRKIVTKLEVVMLGYRSFIIPSVLVIFLLIGVVIFQITHSPSTKSTTPVVLTKEEISITKEIDEQSMYDTIALLSEQPRVAGSDGEKRAIEYIENEFKSLGLETEVQPFPLYDFIENEVNVKINGQDLANEYHAFPGNVNGKVTAPLIHVGKARLGEFGDEVHGKIALIEHGENSSHEKIENVLSNGAVGAIIYHDLPSGDPSAIYKSFPYGGEMIPVIGITRDDGLFLVAKLEAGETIEASLVVDTAKVEKNSYNVIATLRPKDDQDTGEIVTIGAHHDSVPQGPGANDDASGVSAVLELARIFSKLDVDTEIRFLTFGAEELGIIGSSHYVSTLPSEEIDRMVGHFQMDMIGAEVSGGEFPAGGLIMYTPDGHKNLVTDYGAVASQLIFPKAIPYGQMGRSDHLPFHYAGVPAALFTHTPLEPDYHQPSDTVDKISKEKLRQVAQVVGNAVYQIASPETVPVRETMAEPVNVEYPFDERSVQ